MASAAGTLSPAAGGSRDAFAGVRRVRGGHVLALDGIRGVAILMVVIWHCVLCVPRAAWLSHIPLFDAIGQYLWAGVTLFFVLSGFLLGGILVAERDAPGFYRSFFFRRIFRILPLYFAYLLLFFSARTLLLHPADPALFESAAPAWSYFTFCQNVFMALHGSLGGGWLSVSWSLAVEEQFYLLLPFVIAVTPPRRLVPLMVGVVLAVVAFRVVAIQGGITRVLVPLLPARADAFALGIIAAVVSRSSARGRFGSWPIITTTVAGAGFIYGCSGGGIAYMALLYSAMAVVFVGWVWHAATTDGWVSRVLCARPLRWIGAVSYFVYLFHQPANYLIHGWIRGTSPGVQTAAAMATTLFALGIMFAAAELSRRYFEGPLIRYGANLGRRCREETDVNT